ncbi:MAG: glycosyltransferase [Anaerolineaceae bacterium]|nr:glycosyltransferase [Anaerolineaceae bacterium]
MNSYPLVSIITPSFNQAQFLEKTMLSVLGQDYPNIEYLVADGGSTDGSVEIIRKFEDRLAWWVSEKDRGQADAINKGFSRAKGEFIAWVNSDDYYLPGAVSQAVKALQEHPEAGLVYGNVQVVDKDEEIINTLTYGNWQLPDLMTFHIIGQPAVFMRRDALEKAGYLDLSYHFLLDHQLWLRMGLAARYNYVPTLWARAHYHEGCKNLAQAAEFGKEARRIVEWMKSEPAFEPYLRIYQRRVDAGAERLNAFYLLDAGEYHASFRAYYRSLRLDPAAVLPEWYRMVYALFAPLGLEKWKESYLQRRRKKWKTTH